MLLRELASINQGMATAGKGAGARLGNWSLSVVESKDIEYDAVNLDTLRTIDVEQNSWTEKHLLRPYDVLVTARSQTAKIALVPPEVTRTVAASTVLVVRPEMPESGLGHYLWYFLTSRRGRSAVEAQVILGATIPSLSAAALGQVEVALPDSRELDLLANYIEASEEAYAAAIEAAGLLREALRDALVETIAARAEAEKEA
jgi:restriction endonuclease S subunit